MPRPSTPLRDAAWSITLVASLPSAGTQYALSAVRWRDAEGSEGQSSVGAIVNHIGRGFSVRVGRRAVTVVEIGGKRWLVCGGSDKPILDLPSW